MDNSILPPELPVHLAVAEKARGKPHRGSEGPLGQESEWYQLSVLILPVYFAHEGRDSMAKKYCG